MRIMHIITRLIIGGAQENTLLTCHDLQQMHGDEVRLVTGPGLGPEGSLEEEARRLGIDMEVLPMLRRELHPLRDWQSYRAIKRSIRRFRPDIVHTHSGKAGLLGRRAAWRWGVPAIVHTVHGAPFHEYQGRAGRWALRACEKYAAKRCHHLVSVADAMTERMVHAGVAAREKFTTVPSGMDVEPFLRADQTRERVRAQLGFDRDDVVVGKVARFFHLKGHSDFIQAAQAAAAQDERLRFLLVGDGILRRAIEAGIRASGLSSKFRFTGLVLPSDIGPLLGAMDMVVHLSLREGLARVLPQALIAGRPVISYDIDGAREVVLSGHTGTLIAPRDVAAVAAAILEFSAAPSLRERCGREGRSRFTELFRHENATQRLRQLYSRLLQENKTRASERNTSRIFTRQLKSSNG